MNYIIHLNAFLERAAKEQWVVAYHYSLYMALFRIWNKTGFRKTFQIRKTDAMKAARISSKTTYYRCLKELEAAKLLIFYSSSSRFTPAEIEMIPLVNMQDYGTVHVPAGGPQKEENGTPTVPGEGPFLKQENTKYTNSVSKGPGLDDVLKLFLVHEYDTGLGLRFWYQFEATGWKIGNTPIANWQALAHKWMLNTTQPKQKTDNNNDQDYDQSF
ncbi:hypothetical protein SIO70_00805 [Chitinophaga sancti]|uniref:hypothetical protein n=1 Tax=Chitinophaga sancti TaxID=1004 RepID=UPI002A750EFB|nr:hypothetical protein [Chitinophaga sancti]WPQ63401.1 hypothetical protein SIO70_00805 [Chitinophaga sancti]